MQTIKIIQLALIYDFIKKRRMQDYNLISIFMKSVILLKCNLKITIIKSTLKFTNN